MAEGSIPSRGHRHHGSLGQELLLPNAPGALGRVNLAEETSETDSFAESSRKVPAWMFTSTPGSSPSE